MDLMGVNSAGAHETKVSMRVPLYERDGINKSRKLSMQRFHACDGCSIKLETMRKSLREFGTNMKTTSSSTITTRAKSVRQ